MILNVSFVELDQSILEVILYEDEQSFEVDFGDVQTITKYVGGAPYEGSYIVVPRVTEQTMHTKEKVMIDDVLVKAIPFFNVSNTSGGNTVYIGKEV